MKIKWIGKYDGNNLPTVDVGTGAKELPEVTSKSAIILIPIVLLFACCVYIKKTYLGGVAFSRVDWMIGLVIALLFFPVHELKRKGHKRSALYIRGGHKDALDAAAK